MEFVKNVVEKFKRYRVARGLHKGTIARGRTILTAQEAGWQNDKVIDPANAGNLNLKGTIAANVFRANGAREDLGIISDGVVTNAFVAYLVDSFANSVANPLHDFHWHDCGTGTGAEAAANTTLQTPFGGSRANGNLGEGASNNIFKTVGTITFSGPFAITEHGVFSASTSGTLLDRSNFAAINVVANDSIQFTYELTCNSGG